MHVVQGRGAGAVRRLSASVLPPDLPRLRTLVTYPRGELSRTERALAAAEEQRAPFEVARRPAPLRPDWLIEHGIGTGRPPMRVHAGTCWDTRTRCKPASTDAARRALAEGIPA
ncbi:DUF6233 domain-containing protein [Streptomyces sp. NBC_01276]|uniref:DUF6233 domain-containing protein n=1 Tax=Streptomyces sp. NBC_01276 TaxID=2903808 RepID=UPI00352FD41A